MKVRKILRFNDGWLRGVDLNHRPLGYEGKSGLHSNKTSTQPQENFDNSGIPPCSFLAGFVPCPRTEPAQSAVRFLIEFVRYSTQRADANHVS